MSLGRDALELLGMDPYEAYRQMRLFRKNDTDSMPILHTKYKEDVEGYVSLYQQHMSDLEELMAHDITSDMGAYDKAWTVKNPKK